MRRLYEVTTETPSGTRYGTYKTIARTFAEAVAKIQKREIDAYPEHGERIAECRILGSEN